MFFPGLLCFQSLTFNEHRRLKLMVQSPPHFGQHRENFTCLQPAVNLLMVINSIWSPPGRYLKISTGFLLVPVSKILLGFKAVLCMHVLYYNLRAAGLLWEHLATADCSKLDFMALCYSMLWGRKMVNQRLAFCAEAAAYISCLWSTEKSIIWVYISHMGGNCCST